MMETPQKFLKYGDWGASGLVVSTRLEHPEKAWKLRPAPIPCPIDLLHLVVPELYLFITNWQARK